MKTRPIRTPFPVYRLLSVVLLAAVSGRLRAQCPYPCWSPIAAHKFTYESFESVPVPQADPPYEFTLPYPAQAHGAYSASCPADENAGVDLYRYNSKTNTWTGPLTGPTYRNPAFVVVSEKGEGMKGIAIQASFTGHAASYNGKTLVQSVFYHSDRCYHASTEFGFSRYIRGLPGEDQIVFYYEINANCHPTGKCRVHGTGQNLTDQRVNFTIPIPAGRNQAGGTDWLYEAYLIEGGSQWHVRVVDPYSHEKKAEPANVAVSGFFHEAARQFFEHGATGWVTATSSRTDPLELSSDPPVLNLAKIYAAK